MCARSSVRLTFAGVDQRGRLRIVDQGELGVADRRQFFSL
jgi:hypothetical protein